MSPARTARAVPRLTALLLAGALALLTALLTAGPASAHDEMTGSDPADGSTIAAAPARVSVTFEEPPENGFSTLTVVGPDGARHDQGATVTDGSVLSIGVGPLPTAGVYRVGFRVLSDDGHPVSGSVSFTLTTPSPAAAAASPAAQSPAAQSPAPQAPAGQTQPAQPSPAASSSSDGGGLPAWPFVVLAVVVVGGAIALVLRRRA